MINRRVITLFMAFGIVLGCCGCKSEKSVKDKEALDGGQCLTYEVDDKQVEGREIDDTFVSYAADFSIELFKTSALDKIESDKNILVSPQSVLSALSMTANGANGDLLSDMENVLCEGVHLDEHNKYMRTYNNDLEEAASVDFNVANSVWIKDSEDIQVEELFLQNCVDYYDANIYMSMFDEKTVSDINSWVKEETDGMIPSIINEIPDSAVMYLINAISFEGEWHEAYEEYQILEDSEFTSSEGQLQNVTMLSSTENIFICDESSIGFIKPYKDGEYAFMAILPDEDIAVEDYVSEMTGEKFLELYSNRAYMDVVVKLPEFSYEYSDELSECLSNMGMSQAFSETADFSNMATTGNSLYISKVLHKTFIQVDRLGTKAAAATTVEMVSESCEEVCEVEYVILDRPFIYSIIDTNTGLPIFIGVLNSVM